MRQNHVLQTVTRNAESAFLLGFSLRYLLHPSYPEASHDSSSHPASCFPGTRRQYIEDITDWALALTTERAFRLLWMEGPAGVGKSSVVQSCTENIGDKLAAAFFFSRANNRDLPTRLFPSIAYQLSTRYPTYREKLDTKISYDPSLVGKSMNVQFRELIVAPFEGLKKEGQFVQEGAIFIDGLDECAGEDEQCAIIDIISTSVCDRTTPFIWAFSSRPEPRIVARFDALPVRDLCWKLTLPASHDADGDIELYLEDGFRKIRTQYGFPWSALWPPENDIRELVRRSKGLFIYPTSVVRFVGEGGPLGPEEQLRLVLQLSSELTGHNPWSHLDVFYTTIMKQIPKDILPITLKLLFLASIGYDPDYLVASSILGLSLPTYCAALSKLHSVARLTYDAQGTPEKLSIYHASFMDFLENPERSGVFCVKGDETQAGFLSDIMKSFSRVANDCMCLFFSRV